MSKLHRRSPILLILISTLLVTSCKDTGGKVEGNVEGGILDTVSNEISVIWNFLTGGDYTFDSNYIQVSGNKASLKTVNTIFNSSSSFNSGIHVGTLYSGGVLKLDSATGSDTSLSSSWTPHWGSLVGYWKMDGNWLDSSGNARNGTVVGNPTTSGAAKVGTASGSFAGGAGNYVYFTNTSGLNIQDTTFSFSVWFRTTATDGVIVSKGAGNGQTGGFSAGVNSTGYLGITFKDTAGNNAYVFSGTSKVNDGVWHHLAARVTTSTTSGSGNTTSVFLDGKPASGTTTGSVGTPFGINTTDSLALGARGVPLYSGPANYFTGLLDDMAFWSVGLNDSDFVLIYNRQKQKYAGSYDSPVINMGVAAPWSSLSTVNALPFFKELPDSSETSSSYASVAGSLMAGAVAHWKFNGGLNESLSGITMTTTAGTLDYQTAKFASGLRVSDGEVNYTSDARIDQNTTFSFQTWLKSSGAANINYAHIVGKRNLGVAGWTLTNSLASSGKIQLRIDTSAATAQATVSNSATVMDGNWHHIVLVLDGGNGSLYIDGALDKNFTYLPGTGLSNSAPFRFGYETHDTVAEYDEAVYWTRVISSAEVLQLYRRGANRVKYQVRSCIDSSCACRAYNASPAGSASDCDGDGIANGTDLSDSYAASWIGPDGTASTYFSEIQNNTTVDSTGNPTGSVNLTGLTLDWSGSFFPVAARPPSNPYFQYRVYMESDDQNNRCSGSPCLPEVTSITVGPTNPYYGGSPTIVNNTAVNFSQLQRMTKVDSGSCSTYQISTDNGATWKWWDGTAWSTTSNGVSNSNDLSDYTTSRLQSLGGGSFKFKAFLNTNTSGDFTQSCDIQSVGISYSP